MPLATTLLTANGATPTRTLLFLHGILGTRANWRGIARRFVDTRPDWAALLVDLREHGESLGLPGEDTVDQCARDLQELSGPAPIRGALGHSFGGKVAMRWAERVGSVDELWVVDSSPSERPEGANVAAPVVELLRRAIAENPEGFADREAFTGYVVAQGNSQGIADWLAMNLVRLPSGRRGLRLDLDRITAMLSSYAETDTWAALESTRVGAAHVVVGGRSDVVDAADRERIQRLAATRPVFLHVLPTAGHWVHVDAPGPLLDILTKVY